MRTPPLKPNHELSVPPKGNDNFAGVQQPIRHLELHGMAGFVLANGGVSSGPGEIRMALDPRNDFDCC